jgi:hypothetical protein
LGARRRLALQRRLRCIDERGLGSVGQRRHDVDEDERIDGGPIRRGEASKDKPTKCLDA